MIEDDHDQIAMLVLLLRRHGFDVHSVSSASAGLELLESEAFDVVVSDFRLPEVNGVELVSRLAQDDVVLTLVKDGDHRLSRPEDIERLLMAVAEFT